MIFIYTIVAKRPDSRIKLLFTPLWPKCQIAEQSCVNAKLVTNEHSSRTIQHYNMHTITETET